MSLSSAPPPPPEVLLEDLIPDMLSVRQLSERLIQHDVPTSQLVSLTKGDLISLYRKHVTPCDRLRPEEFPEPLREVARGALGIGGQQHKEGSTATTTKAADKRKHGLYFSLSLSIAEEEPSPKRAKVVQQRNVSMASNGGEEDSTNVAVRSSDYQSCKRARIDWPK